MSKRKQSGMKAKQNGANFEKFIEASCTYYRTKGIADIHKTPEPMKPISVLNPRYGHFKAVYEKKGQPDFLGTLKGGQSIMIEAKHTEKTNITFDRIPEHQATALESTTQLGGVALVLISFNLKNFYCIRWSDWKKLQEETGKKSANEKDLAPFKIEFKGHLEFIN